MVDQLASAKTCPVCGALPDPEQFHPDGLCGKCAADARAVSNAGLSSEPPAGFVPVAAVEQERPPDPDQPSWGPATGVAVWVASVAAIVVIPIIAVVVWFVIQSVRGAPLPNLAVASETVEWLKSPTLLLVQVWSTIVAHAVTVGICWMVVSRMGRRPFWASLGWSWAGHSLWYWLVFSACIIVALLLATQLLSKVIPQSEENSFTELLKSSGQVRIAVAILATFSAPLVEELVYRGVLYSGLHRAFGLFPTVVFVTLMFAGVHVLQYFGSWVSLSGLTLLSLALTLIRARTRSILPCVVIHAVNNAFFSVLVLMNKAT